jgi:hypothetical protein
MHFAALQLLLTTTAPPAGQVITGDDWNLVMFAVVEHKPVASLIYFVVVIVIGTYLFVNLFIASETRRAAGVRAPCSLADLARPITRVPQFCWAA